MKLFVFDVDGTLVTRSQRLRKDTITSLNKILDNGDAIAIASGRAYSGIRKYLALLHNGLKFAICANGASLVDFDGNIIYKLMIPFSLLVDLHHKYLDLIKRENVGIYCYLENAIGYFEYTKWIRNEKVANNINAINLSKSKIVFDSIYKIMISAKKEISEKFVFDAYIYENYHVVRSSPLFLEIINKKTDKVYGVNKLAQLLKINSKDVYTFGDSNNDLMMIKEYNGVAMDNATLDVKKACKIITKSCLEDGVSYAINHLIKL